MKLISWNVNGIRAVLKKGFLESVRRINPDILCLQEVRALPEQIDLDLPGYERFWNPAEKKGYSGTAILTRVAPLNVSCGINRPDHDTEGRVITMEFGDYYLVTVYTPNAGRGLDRLPYRTEQWDIAFLEYVKELEGTKPVVFCGDLNVAHKEIDLANPKRNEGNAGFTPQERRGFDRIIRAGFIDTFREFNDEGGNYTWWSYMARAREKNIGWRIDYFCISAVLRDRLKTAEILSDVIGSDHCPIAIELD